MKLVTFETVAGERHIGALLGGDAAIADLTAAWVKNITDEEYFRNVAIQGPSGLGQPGDPRTFGATLTLNFN